MADWEQLRALTQEVATPDFATLERTARHRQRRARAAGALAALVLVGGGVGLAALGDDGGRGPLEPAEDPSDSISEDTEPLLTLPERAEGESAVEIGAGRYLIPLTDTLAFEVDLPAPTTAHEDGVFLATEDFIVKTEVAPASAYGVPRDPCRDHTIRPVGPTVDDLVEALTDLPIYRVSRPEPVELGGGEGFYLEARVPRTFDASDCEGSAAVQLPGNPGSAVGGPPPYRGRWWVLEVDGQRVVIQQNCWDCDSHVFDRAPQTPQSIVFRPTS